MANSRVPVPPPAKRTLGYGLRSVAESRANGSDGRWRAGVIWNNVCPDADTTYDQCTSRTSGAAANPPTPPAKAATAERSLWGATPFTVYVEIDCSPDKEFWDNVDAIVSRTFTEAEDYTIERAFLTGIVGGQTLVFPHLQSTTQVVDSSDGSFLQLIATPLVTGGPLDVVEAVGRMDAALSACVMGEGVLHVTPDILAAMHAQHLVRERDGILYSPRGHRIAAGIGYTGASPAGTLTDGTSWMYGTGPIFMYNSPGTFVGTRAQSLDRSVDTLKRIFERTYVIGYDCCLFAVPVSTGGVDAGTVGTSS